MAIIGGGFDVGSVVAKVKADISNFKKGIGEAQASTKSFSKKLVSVGAVAGTAFAAVGVAAAGAAAAIGVAALKEAAAFEQAEIAFTTMLGSAEAAKKMLEELAQFAKRTPFELKGIEQNAKQLLAMGIESDKIIPTIKALGDVSAGLNVPMERLSLNFGQVKTQGKLTGRELRDFNVAGVPLIETLAKLGNEGKLSAGAFREVTEKGSHTGEQMIRLKDRLEIAEQRMSEMAAAGKQGTSSFNNQAKKIAQYQREIGGATVGTKTFTEQLSFTKEGITEMVSEGKISFEDVALAFETMTGEGGKFFDLMDKQSGTLTGQIENLKDEFSLLLREIGKELLPVAKRLVSWAINNLIPMFQRLVGWIVNQAVPSIKEFAASFVNARDKIAPIIDFITGLFFEYKDDMISIFESIRGLVDKFIEKFKKSWDVWGEAWIVSVKGFLNIIGSIIKNALNIIVGIVGFVLAILNGDWDKAWESIKKIVGSAADVVKTIIFSLLDSFIASFKAMFNGAVEWMTKAWDKVKEIAGKIRDAVAEAFDKDERNSPSVNDRLKDLVSTATSELGKITVPKINAQVANAMAIPATTGGAGNSIVVNLDGAIIADPGSAERMGEIVGDSIIRKLGKHVRF
jgi:phage-related protein